MKIDDQLKTIDKITNKAIKQVEIEREKRQAKRLYCRMV